MGDRVSGEELAKCVCRQTDRPNRRSGHVQTRKVTDTESGLFSSPDTRPPPCADARVPRCVCRQPHIPAPARSLPPPHARLSPSSRRPRSPHRAESPPRPLPLPIPASVARPPGAAAQCSPCLFSLCVSASLALGRVCVHLWISVRRMQLSDAVIFHSQTLHTFPSLSVLTWVEGPEHHSRPHRSHPRGRGRGGSCLSARPSPASSLINFSPAASGSHRASPPPAPTASPGWDTLCPPPPPRLPAVLSGDREQEAN